MRTENPFLRSNLIDTVGPFSVYPLSRGLEHFRCDPFSSEVLGSSRGVCGRIPVIDKSYLGRIVTRSLFTLFDPVYVTYTHTHSYTPPRNDLFLEDIRL